MSEKFSRGTKPPEQTNKQTNKLKTVSAEDRPKFYGASVAIVKCLINTNTCMIRCGRSVVLSFLHKSAIKALAFLFVKT